VLKAARELDPKIRVIMLTGEKEIELAERTLTLGATEYVTKPFDIDYLKGEVRRLLRLEAGDEPRPDGAPWRIDPDIRH